MNIGRRHFFCLKLGGASSIVLIPFISRSRRFYWGRHAHLHVYLCGLQLADLAGTFDFSCHTQDMVCHFLSPVFHHLLWLHRFCDLNRIFTVKVRSGLWKRTPDVEKCRQKPRFTYMDIHTRSVRNRVTFHHFFPLSSLRNSDNFPSSIYIICSDRWAILVY